MKYMGSKRFMLTNGLGDLLNEQIPLANRVVDPFCGAGSIIQFAATSFDKVVLAGDLQKYAQVLAAAMIERTTPVDATALFDIWEKQTLNALNKSALYRRAVRLDLLNQSNVRRWVSKARTLCREKSRIGPVWNAYGGHYYSSKQALELDFFLKKLPKSHTNLCRAALIVAAARCATAPGHTAQPFQPKRRAIKFIRIAWKMDIFRATKVALAELSAIHAKKKGNAYVADAKALVSKVFEGDLVILDPPYSGVQYSRFYHVLETIARGHVGKVAGVGRYPDLKERPQSKFSNSGQALRELESLLKKLADKKATVIFTFPRGECSNGLSGDLIMQTAEKWFEIAPGSRMHEHDVIVGKFSTLGGNNKSRKGKAVKPSRVKSEELLLLLKPRKPSSFVRPNRIQTESNSVNVVV